MSNYTVENLNKYRSEIKDLITNVFPNFPGLDKVYFKHPEFGNGVFGPTSKLFFSIGQTSNSFTTLDKDHRDSPGNCVIQAVLEITPINVNIAISSTQPPKRQFGEEFGSPFTPHYVELASLQINKLETRNKDIEKYIDDIFIGIVRNNLNYSDLSNIESKLKGISFNRTSRETEFTVKNNDDKLLFQYYSNNHLGHNTLAELDAVAVALVMIPENHQIEFKEIKFVFS